MLGYTTDQSAYTRIVLEQASQNVWTISPPQEEKIRSDLINGTTLSTLTFSVAMTRTSAYYSEAVGEFKRVLSHEEEILMADLVLNGGRLDLQKVFPYLMHSLPNGQITYVV